MEMSVRNGGWLLITISSIEFRDFADSFDDEPTRELTNNPPFKMPSSTMKLDSTQKFYDST